MKSLIENLIDLPKLMYSGGRRWKCWECSDVRRPFGPETKGYLKGSTFLGKKIMSYVFFGEKNKTKNVHLYAGIVFRLLVMLKEGMCSQSSKEMV